MTSSAQKLHFHSVPEIIDHEDKRARARRITLTVLKYLVLVLIACFMLLPFYWALLCSFRPNILNTQLPVTLYPTEFTFSNYSYVFQEVDVLQYIGNTLIVIALIILFQLTTCAMAAYSLARLEWKGKKIVHEVMMLSMMIPGVITLVPQFLVVATLGLVDSLWGIIVPAMFSIYGVLFMRSFFLSTPPEIAEAARIDGANEPQIFFRLYLPMVVPGLITLGLFTFNSNWNSYLWPSLILDDPNKYVLAQGINLFNSMNNEEHGAVMAMAIVSVIPSVVIFLVGQRYFMENLTFAGIK